MHSVRKWEIARMSSSNNVGIARRIHRYLPRFVFQAAAQVGGVKQCPRGVYFRGNGVHERVVEAGRGYVMHTTIGARRLVSARRDRGVAACGDARYVGIARGGPAEAASGL